MKKLTVAAVAVSAIALLPMSTLASGDREEIKEACRQAAIEEEVEMVEIVDYIADCVATNLGGEEAEGTQEEEAGGTQEKE